MSEDERSPRPPRPDLSSDAALDRLLRRLGPLMRWQDYEETSAPEEESTRPDPAFARRLRARLTEEEEATPPRDRREGERRVALRVGLVAATLAVVILVAVAVVEVGVVAALTTALALVALAAVLIVRARLGS